MSNTKEKSGSIIYLHYLIGLGLMFFGRFLPPIDPLTPLGVNMLTIFVGVAYLWIFTDSIAASLLSFVAIALSGYMPFMDILGAAISDSIVLVLLFGFIFFGSIMSCGLTPYIANFFLSRKIIEGRPLVFVGMLMLTEFALAAMGSQLMTTLFMWTIAYAVLDSLGYKKTDTFSAVLILGIFFGGCYGGCIMPFKGPVLIAIGAFEAATGIDVDYYFVYMFLDVLLFVITTIIYLLMAKFVFKADLTKIKNVKVEQLKNDKLPPMSKVQKINLIFVFLFMLLVIVPTMVPETLPGVALLKSFDAAGIAIILISILCIMRVDGKPVADFKKMAGMIQWPVLFMVMSAVFLASVMKDTEATGVLPFFKKVLNPVLGTSNEMVFALIIFIAGTILTSFFHNGILSNMMAPIIVAFSISSGFNGVAVCIIMTLLINIVAYLTPAASVYAPLIHGNKEWLTMKQIWIIGGSYALVNILVLWLVGFPIAKWFFAGL